MMRLEQVGPLLTEAEIAKFESEFQVGISEQYRRFLLRTNGGLPKPDTVDIDGVPGSPTDVQAFFGIGRVITSSDLYWNARAFADQILCNRLPIACDSGGNIFCLQCSGDQQGQVLYIDIWRDKSIGHFVSADFDGFVQKIREFEIDG